MAKQVLRTYAQAFLIEVLSGQVELWLIEGLAFALAEVASKELLKC